MTAPAFHATDDPNVVEVEIEQPVTPAAGDEVTLKRLAELPSLDYDRVRKEEAAALGVRPGTLDKIVEALRKDQREPGIGFEDIEPWPERIEPALLLTELAVTVRRFIVCADETTHAVALWSAMTWFIDVVQVAPLAVITAPEKRCGKSQTLFILGRLCRRPLTASNISPAALFRTIDAWAPTMLVDEADSFMRENEELRGLLNCGHTRDSAYIVRVVGENFTPTRFNVWGAKALAGIGSLSDTLMDRAIVLPLRRKRADEPVERLRHAEPELFETLAAKLARFAEDSREAIRLARPDLPSQLNDRAQDNWEPLLAIADVAGGDWPELARRAALRLSGAESPSQSVGTELLADIQEVFETKRLQRIFTHELIAELCQDNERPWSTYNRGKPISPRQVSNKLEGYGIRSKNVRIGHLQMKGFEFSQFEETFSRYLSHSPELSVPPSQARNDKGFSGTDSKRPNGTDIGTGTVAEKPSVPLEAAPRKGWDVGTDRSWIAGEKILDDDSEVF
ncbi:MAG: DUF3631 domain-containing protein [Methylococcus sp.]|nr:DUF3631 domain-containing protein [Methylococcus sp.]